MFFARSKVYLFAYRGIRSSRYVQLFGGLRHFNRIKGRYYAFKAKQSGKSLRENLKELKSIVEGISEGIRK